LAKHRNPHPADQPDSLDEIESWGEQAAEWISDHAAMVLGTVALVLVVAAGYGISSNIRADAEMDAADALAETRASYLRAMGAAPGDIVAPELANPTAGAEIRSDYVPRFREVALDHPGTVGGALAQLEEGNLVSEGGDDDGALAIWRGALEALSGEPPIAGLLHQRIAQTLEADGDWLGAAEAYEAAAGIDNFTFATIAAADAARCYLEADQTDKALSLFAQVEAAAPDLPLPDYLRIRFRELEAVRAN
jgi:tetratricopeptide (TPR) repeat protein